MVLILSQMHPVYTFPPYSRKMKSYISSHLRLDLASGLLHQIFLTKILYELLIPVCPFQALLLDYPNNTS
jgi:hypothetical protein